MQMEEDGNNQFTGEIFEPEMLPQNSNLSNREQRELFDRHENKTFHWVKIALIIIFGFYIVVLSAVVLFHLLAPVCWRWLSDGEVASLEKMFVTGIGAALLGKFGSKLADFG